MPTKEEALRKIELLVQRFDEQKEFYQNADYNEMQTRRDFIDPFWKALGWDVDNENGNAESYREVIHEDRLKVGGATKAPDYSFRLPGGKRLFFLEAKKPSVAVKSDIESAYQIRCYGWSANMLISIISDFEEFAIYDCTKKPLSTDKASVARIKYLTYHDYLTEFAFLWNTFSKEQVLKGSFDKYIQSDRNKKGTTTVDKDFLDSLDKWRVELARNIALRNEISEEELNFVVQSTIDRIVFLRIAEDRNVERYGELHDAIQSGNYYQNLLRRFHLACQKYDSGLFDFDKDTVSTRISIDNKVIKSIISELYYPKSPYSFSVLSVEILGNAYEQFLGKRISLSKGGRATIKEKPEVFKTGGVYYTPQYIVDYIVKKTVGKLVENKTPKEVSKLTIVDPACGSGSFLLGAYQFLMDWHRDYYLQYGKPGKGRKSDTLTPNGKLTTAEKKRILLDNIYGVDLDNNAVEVAKLSLLLKCMEGETTESIEVQQKLFHDRVLPDLDDNIKSGNSLIGTDFYLQGELNFSDCEYIKTNCFDWKNEFPKIFSAGGFDAVIGNPPYVFTRELMIDSHKKYFYENYKNTQFKLNTYILFSEKAHSILSNNGLFGFIIPNNWLTLEYSSEFRKFILENTGNVKIVTTEDKVFAGASVDVSILIYEKIKSNIVEFFVLDGKTILQTGKIKAKTILQKHNHILNFKSDQHSSLQEKIEKASFSLKTIAEVKNGVQAYTVGEGTPKQTKVMKDERVYHSNKKFDKTWVKYVDGVDVKRYSLGWSGQYIKYGNNLSRPRRFDLFHDDRILVRQIPSKPPYSIFAAFVDKTTINDNNSMIIKVIDGSLFSIKFILGIINSKLISYWFIHRFGKLQRSIFPQFKINELREFIIPNIDLSLKADKAKHDNLVLLVDKMLELKLRESTISLSPQLTTTIRRQIDGLDGAIDMAVYELYGLTEAEIKIIETNQK